MKFNIKGLSSDFYDDFSLSGESGNFYNIVYKKSLLDRDLAKYLSLIKKDKKFSFIVDDKDITNCDLGNSPVFYIGNENPFSLCYRITFKNLFYHIFQHYSFVDDSNSKLVKDRWLIARLKESLKVKTYAKNDYAENLIKETISFLKNNRISQRKKPLKKSEVDNRLKKEKEVLDFDHYFDYPCIVRSAHSYEILIVLGLLLGKKIFVIDNINRFTSSKNTRGFWRIYSLINKNPSLFKDVSFINIVESLSYANSKAITYCLNDRKFEKQTDIDFNNKFNNEISIFYSSENDYFSKESFTLDLNKINSIFCDNSNIKDVLFKNFYGNYNYESYSITFPTTFGYYEYDNEYSIIENKKSKFAVAIIPKLFELGLLYGKDINFNLEQFYLHHCSERDNYSDLIDAENLINEYKNDIEFLNNNSEKVHQAYIAHKNDVIKYLDKYDVKDSLRYSSKLSYDEVDNYQTNYNKVIKLFSKNELQTKVIDLDEVTRLKVRIAQQLMIDSKLFVFDDLLSHFDEKNQKIIVDEIFNFILKKGCTILYITDKMTNILKLSEKVYFMKNNTTIKVGKYNKN